MTSPVATQDQTGQYRRSLVLSALVHVLLLLALSSSLILIPRKPIPSRAISAFVVDENSLKQATATKERPPQPVAEVSPPKEQPPKEEQVEQRQKQQEAERQEQERKAAEAEAERKVQERKATEARRKAETERKQEQERKAAEAKAEAARKEQERKAAEEARAEAERKEQQRKAAEAARRQAELAAAMAAEEDLLAAQRSGEMDRYIALIQQKVERNWVPPASAQPGLECEVAVVQLPNGDVVDARTVRCNGDAAVQRSVEAAVMRSSPLPLPDNPRLFERNLRFIFKPQQ